MRNSIYSKTLYAAPRFLVKPLVLACLFNASLPLVSGIAHATSTYEIADGVSLVLLPGNYTNYDGRPVISALNGGTVDGNDLQILNLAPNSQSVFAESGGVINLHGGSIRKYGDYSQGVLAVEGAAVNLTNVEVVSVGPNSVGLQSARGGLINQHGGSITTFGPGSQGALAVDGATVHLTNVEVVNHGPESVGVKSVSGGMIKLYGGSITTSGGMSLGAVASGGNSTVELNNTDIRTDGESSHGVSASGVNEGIASVATLNNSRVLTTGWSSFGVQSNDGGLFRANNSLVLTTGDMAAGIHVLSGALTTSVADLINTDVRTEGVGSSGAIVKGVLNINGGSLVSAQYSAIQSIGDAGIGFSNGAKVAGGNGVLLSVSDEVNEVSFSLDGQAHALGNIVFDPGADTNADGLLNSNIHVTMNNGSLWEGSTTAVNTLSLANSSWYLTDDSIVRSLELDNGNVKFDHTDGTFKVLRSEALTGSGRFLMNTDLAGLQGDLLVVTGEGLASGHHELVVGDSGYEPISSDGKLMLVDTNGGSAKFSLYGDHVDAGAFRYDLQQHGDDWFLSGVGATPVAPPTPAPDNLSKGANAAVAAHTASNTLWSAQMNALVKRLGELRMGEDEGGIWTRGISKRFVMSEQSSRAFTQDVTGIEIGADKAVSVDNGKLYVGGMVGTASAKLNFGEGASGTTDSKMIGAYTTYLNDNGVYVDAVLKYSDFDNNIKMSSNIGEAVKGAYKTNGFGADIEVGKHIKLNSGWFIEPQLEITATRTQAGAYTASNGLKVESDDMDSLQSRVGMLFGRSLELSSGIKAQPYVKASYVTEHAGNSKVNINGNKIAAELPGNRTELGFGGVLQVSEKSKISLDGEYAKGSSIEQPWGLTLGYRYLW